MAAAGMQNLKLQWHNWAARFAALQQREKVMVVGATLIVILFGGYSLWIEPAQLQAARLTKTLAQQQTELAELNAQLAALAAQMGDPDAPNRAALEQIGKQLAETDREIHGFDRVLITPAQAPALLQTLLAKHRGLSLVSLNTLPPQPLIAPPAKKDAKPGEESGKPATAVPGGNIYKHGIEIKIAGGYQDLLTYVRELESGPQKLLWGGMSLNVQKHPISELTLTVYSLSLESAWLVV